MTVPGARARTWAGRRQEELTRLRRVAEEAQAAAQQVVARRFGRWVHGLTSFVVKEEVGGLFVSR